MADQGKRWDQLVDASVENATTAESQRSWRCAQLTLHKSARRNYLANHPREIAKIQVGLREAIRCLCSGETPWPLFLHGDAGTGKTLASLCLLDHSNGVYFTVNELTQLCIDVMKGEAKYESGNTIHSGEFWEEMGNCPLVVLDELGMPATASL